MKRSELLTSVRNILKEWEPNEIIEESHIFNDLGFDSLDAIEFIMDCENVFNITIEDSEAEKINTIKEVLDFLEANLK